MHGVTYHCTHKHDIEAEYSSSKPQPTDSPPTRNASLTLTLNLTSSLT